MHNIQIDSEFQALIPPLSAEERAQLEANLLADGCRDPLVVWVQPAPEPGTHKCYAHDESKCDLVPEDDVWHCRHCEHNPAQQEYVLIDGHNRHEICTRLGLPFDTVEMEFYSREDVVVWMVDNQDGRRNLNAFQRTELQLRKKAAIAAKAKANQSSAGGDKVSEKAPYQISDKAVEPIHALKEIAKAAGVSHDTVHKVEKILGTEEPEIVQAVRSGDVSINLASQFVELPQEVQQEAIAAIAERHEPAKEVMREAVKKAHVANNSGNNEWYTPPKFIELARQVMGGIDLDPATSEVANRVVQAPKIFTADDDGRAQQWSGRVWMNPPYAQPLMGDFAEAVSAKYESGEIDQACILVNNGTETQWFQRMLGAADAVCFPKTRIKFIDPDGNPSGAPLQGQAILYMGGNVAAFTSLFAEEGVVLTHA